MNNFQQRKLRDRLTAIKFQPFASITAIIFLFLTLPAFFLISLAIYCRYGRPIFYKGRRLGQNKKPFSIYKFRTLSIGAEAILGSKLLSDSQIIDKKKELVTPMGNFLRTTRLDELPQLFNIAVGHMSFMGPRPERPIVYNDVCAKIPNYHQRFKVRPGLFGYSQVFTPHCTPKKMRSSLNNKILKTKCSFFNQAFFTFCILWSLISKTIQEGLRLFVFKIQGKEGFLKIKKSKYLQLQDSRIMFSPFGNEGPKYYCQLTGISETTILLESKTNLPNAFSQLVKICRWVPNGKGELRLKSAFCMIDKHKPDQGSKNNLTEFKYQPISPLNAYKIHQYFLENSIADLRLLMRWYNKISLAWRLDYICSKNKISEQNEEYENKFA